MLQCLSQHTECLFNYFDDHCDALVILILVVIDVIADYAGCKILLLIL